MRTDRGQATTDAALTEEGPRHLFSVGPYERDVLAGRFGGTRKEWQQWKRDPGAFEEARRNERERRLRESWHKRTPGHREPVQYADPLVPLETITDYHSPVFDRDTREWFAYHARLCTV